MAYLKPRNYKKQFLQIPNEEKKMSQWKLLNPEDLPAKTIKMKLREKTSKDRYKCARSHGVFTVEEVDVSGRLRLNCADDPNCPSVKIIPPDQYEYTEA